MSKKVDTSALDTDFIIGQTDRKNRTNLYPPANQLAEERIESPPEVIEPMKVEAPPIAEPPREESKRRRTKVDTIDYKSLFLHEATVVARSGKTVYICKEHHDRIMKILHVIAKNEVSLFSYLFNVLEHHFSGYQQEITELYDNNYEKPF